MENLPIWWGWLMAMPDITVTLFVLFELFAVAGALIGLAVRPMIGSILLAIVLVTVVTVYETAFHTIDYKHAKSLSEHYQSVNNPVHAEYTLGNYREISYWDASRRFRDVNKSYSKR